MVGIKPNSVAIKIPFNKPYFAGREMVYVDNAYSNGKLSGNGSFTKDCESLIDKILLNERKRTLLVHSGTAALEMALRLCDLEPGDEVILPSYTFCSCATAVISVGAVPVFADIEAQSLCLDFDHVETLISNKTRVLMVVHYAGRSADMSRAIEIGNRYRLRVIEDCAHAFGVQSVRGALGTIGDFGCFSFHETKNISCGEGGAITINDSSLIRRAEIIREKGTNRADFDRLESSKYEWLDYGSSYCPSEVTAAILKAQLECFSEIQSCRRSLWVRYQSLLKALNFEHIGALPYDGNLPISENHGYHIFYVLMHDAAWRQDFISHMRAYGILTPFHYVPLHSSIGGKKFAKTNVSSDWLNTDRISSCIVRFPLYMDLSELDQEVVVEAAVKFVPKNSRFR